MTIYSRRSLDTDEALLVSWQRDLVGDHSQVYLLTDAGLRQLTHNTRYDYFTGYWAADGHSCFVTTQYGDTGHLYVYGINSPQVRELGANDRVKHKLWLSPDGQRLAYWEHPSQPNGGLVIHQWDTDQRTVVENVFRLLDWRWSADSQSLAGIGWKPDNSPMWYRFGLDGTELERRPLPHFQGKTVLLLSPNWQRVAYAETDESDELRLMTAKLDGSEIHRLGILNDMESPPVWSPDSTLLAWVGLTDRSTEQRFRLFVAKADGTEQRILMVLDEGDESGEIYPGVPAWSADSQRIAIASFVEKSDVHRDQSIDAGSAVFIINVGSGLVRQVSDAAGIIYDIQWRPV